MKMQLTIYDVIAVVGDYERKRQDEYEFQCPLCANEGHDYHKDNLKFNERKGVLQCFANSEHSKQIFKKIIKNIKNNSSYDFNTENYTYKNSNAELTEERKEEFLARAIVYNQELLQSDFLLEVLFESRGITKETVAETYIGYNNELKCWVFPTFEYNTSTYTSDNKIIGFEYRPTDFSKKGLRREKNTPTALAMINEYKLAYPQYRMAG